MLNLVFSEYASIASVVWEADTVRADAIPTDDRDRVSGRIRVSKVASE